MTKHWIETQIEALKGAGHRKNKSGLARALNVDPARVSDIIKGRRRVQPHEYSTIAAYLRMPKDLVVGLATGEEKAPFTGMIDASQEQFPAAPEDGYESDIVSPQFPMTLPSRHEKLDSIPIYGTVEGGNDGGFELGEVPVDVRRRPPKLADAKDVYGLYVIGDSMEPAYYRGDLILVNPRRPPSIGSIVVVQIRESEHGKRRALLKRLVRRTANTLRLEQFNPPESIEIPADQVESVHLVLTMDDVVGV